jgi:undecaprenyl-diphosphatase
VKNLGLAVAALSVLALSGMAVDGDHVPGLDRTVFSFLNDLPGFLYRPLWPVMQLGNFLVVPAALVLALILRRWVLAVGIALVGLGKMYGGQVVKDLYVRHRPAALLDGVHARDDTGLGQAFVSGHVVVAIGLATLAHPYLGRRGRIVVWTLAAVVAVGRVYVGAHFPLDVIGGAAFGCAMGCAFHAIVGAPQSRAAASEERDTPQDLRAGAPA